MQDLRLVTSQTLFTLARKTMEVVFHTCQTENKLLLVVYLHKNVSRRHLATKASHTMNVQKFFDTDYDTKVIHQAAGNNRNHNKNEKQTHQFLSYVQLFCSYYYLTVCTTMINYYNTTIHVHLLIHVETCRNMSSTTVTLQTNRQEVNCGKY